MNPKKDYTLQSNNTITGNLYFNWEKCRSIKMYTTMLSVCIKNLETT